MPGVLSEGMFLSNAQELRLLRRPAVRARMAAAYYDAIARYLARRSTHVGYELIEGPQVAVTAGETVSYAIEVRNQGNEAIRGWRLGAAAFPAPEHYIGRIRKGRSAGDVAIPQLAPGDSVVVSVDVATPASGGDWMLLFDAQRPGWPWCRASRQSGAAGATHDTAAAVVITRAIAVAPRGLTPAGSSTHRAHTGQDTTSPLASRPRSCGSATPHRSSLRENALVRWQRRSLIHDIPTAET